MGVMHSYRFRSASGSSVEASLAKCINVERMPAARTAILDGIFHRIPNPDGDGFVTVEKPFVYVDLPRGTVILVAPRGERHQHETASARYRSLFERIPAELLGGDGKGTRRVVFGLGELREKLVAEDAGLDDRMVELMKILLVYEHPVLAGKTRLRIVLESVGAESIRFVATHDHGDRAYRLALPRSVADGLDEGRKLLERTLDRNLKRNPLKAAPGEWVNMWQLSPSNTALATLRKIADALASKPKAKITAKATQAPEFRQMLAYLPRGSHLPAWAKRALRALFVAIKGKPGMAKLEDSLWEIRFDRALEDDWYLNDDPNDIDTLWKVLKDLPDTNVEGNTSLGEIFLDAGGGSGAYYAPGAGDIHVGDGALASQEWFEDVVRHEVGHSVHEKFRATVDAWLQQRFGWRRFAGTDAGIDAWVAAIGGYGNVSATQRSEIRGYIRAALGPGSSWFPPTAPVAPAGHPWNAAGYPPRLAFEQTGDHWYNRYGNWFRSGGSAFFFNFWYAELMVVGETTLNLVDQMPSTYAAMSPFEFFAETYALYYDLDDPLRGTLPADVGTWLAANIGTASANQPAMPGLAPRHFRRRAAAK